MMQGKLLVPLTLCLLLESNSIIAILSYEAPQGNLVNLHPVRENSNFKNYVNTYLNNLSQRDNPLFNQQRGSSFYSVPHYEPVYQEGYLTKRPRIKPELLETLLPYVGQSEPNDYFYDYNVPPYNPYADDVEESWYDSPASLQENNVDNKNQEAALFKLLVDHLAGKYSLEDLETLERQEAIDKSVENQLRSLPQAKNIQFRPKSFRPVKKGGNREHKNTFVNGGQKEIPSLLPSLPHFPYPQFNQRGGQEKSISTTSKPAATQPTTQQTSKASTKAPSILRTTVSTSEQQETKDTRTSMEPPVNQAYQAFRNFLDRERYLRKVSDESQMNLDLKRQTLGAKEKRFISDPISLTKQLSNLKTRNKV